MFPLKYRRLFYVYVSAIQLQTVYIFIRMQSAKTTDLYEVALVAKLQSTTANVTLCNYYNKQYFYLHSAFEIYALLIFVFVQLMIHRQIALESTCIIFTNMQCIQQTVSLLPTCSVFSKLYHFYQDGALRHKQEELVTRFSTYIKMNEYIIFMYIYFRKVKIRKCL